MLRPVLLQPNSVILHRGDCSPEKDTTAALSAVSVCLFGHSVVPSSLWPHRLQHPRLPCPSLSPGVSLNSCPLSQYCNLSCPTISSSSFCSCFNLFQHQGLFQGADSSHGEEWPKYWSFRFSISPSSEYSGFISELGSTHLRSHTEPRPCHERTDSSFNIQYQQFVLCRSAVSNSLRPHGLYSPPGSSVCLISQAGIPEWVAISFSREYQQYWLSIFQPQSLYYDCRVEERGILETAAKREKWTAW